MPEGTENKGNENKGNFDAEAAKARIAELEKENSGLLKETLSKKELIKNLETQKQTEEQERLKEQNKYKELYESNVSKVKRVEEVEPVLNQILETEIGEIPEDKRDLIPNFEKPEQKLLWVRNAKSKGLFSVGKETKAPASTVQSKVNTDGTLPEYLGWANTDERLKTLSIAEFQKWRQHNQKAPAGVRGWGKA